jgi:hypothetical protein
MSGNWERHADSDRELATTLDRERSFGGKGYDRIHGDNPIPGVSSTIAMMGDNDEIEVDITAGQKMLSAMSGSLLTSLLGTLTDRFDELAQGLILYYSNSPRRCPCPSTIPTNPIPPNNYPTALLNLRKAIQHPSPKPRSNGMLPRSLLRK